MRVYALVPARSGPKGLPDKNILEIDGRPLIGHAIAFGLSLGIDRALVSTDSECYAGIARQWGGECPFLRAEAASSDASREEDILDDLDERLPHHGIELPDVWVWLKPTSPFRRRDAVLQGLEILRTRLEVDSVRLVSEADARLQVINPSGLLEPLLEEWPSHLSKIPRTTLVKTYHPLQSRDFSASRLAGKPHALHGPPHRAPPAVAHYFSRHRRQAMASTSSSALMEACPRPRIVSDHVTP